MSYVQVLKYCLIVSNYNHMKYRVIYNAYGALNKAQQVDKFNECKNQ